MNCYRKIKSNIRCVTAWLALFALPAQAQVCMDSFPNMVNARDVAYPVYLERQIAALVRVDRVFTDYETKGFFRIGVLPILVLDGVTIELRHPIAPGCRFSALDEAFGSRIRKRFELRRVKIIDNTSLNRLEAGRVCVTVAGRWELLDGVTFISGTNQTQAAIGFLDVAGARAGEILIETTPPVTRVFVVKTLLTADDAD